MPPNPPTAKLRLVPVLIAAVPAVLVPAGPATAQPIDVTTLPVAEVQQDLVRLGASIEVTGVWDEQTSAAWGWFLGKYRSMALTENVTPAGLAKLEELADSVRIPAACRKKNAVVLCADTRLQTVRLFANGKQVRVTDAVFGIGNLATRKGVHRIHAKARYLISDLSGTAMPYSLFFSGGQALHYSEPFRKRGYQVGTLGCVAVGDKSFAIQAFKSMNTGDRVVVY